MADIEYVAWRRKVDSRDAWMLLPGTKADSKVGAYNLAMDEELKEGDMNWEYMVMPVGQPPTREGDREHYRTRELRRR